MHTPTPSTPTPNTPTPPPAPDAKRSGRGIGSLALYLTVAVLGGAVALGGAAVTGALDGTSSTTIVRPSGGGTKAVTAVGGNTLSINEIYRQSGPGVVQITSKIGSSTSSNGQNKPAGQSLGSGFVMDREGHIITNYHVIDGATTITVRFSNDDTLTATLVGSDPSTDVALLKVNADADALTPLVLADSRLVEVGDAVVAIGNPFGLERTVTSGIVSALQRNVEAPNGYSIDHVIQTDAAINHGNSGGPLLNTHGAVIGINSQIETGGSGDGNVGIGFAVPSNTVSSVVAQILRDGKVRHAYLGVSIVEVTSDIAKSFKLPVTEGLAIQSVNKGSGADNAGLEAGTRPVTAAGESYRTGGDVIVAADGKDVATMNDLRDVIASHRPGDRIELKIYRDGSAKTVTVTLGQQPPTPVQ
ncbi:MAG: trypsin-like peptidase domain-containing protein [Thermoleophilia bacterium]